MHFISGFAGASITEDEFIKTQMGWAVAESTVNKEKREKAQEAPKEEAKN